MRENYVTAGQLARHINGVVWGNHNAKIYNIALPKDSTNRSLTYFEAGASEVRNRTTTFSVCIVPLRYKICDERTYIVVNKNICEIIHEVINFLIQSGIYKVNRESEPVIGQNTVISEKASIGKKCRIGNGVFIAEGVRIGDCCRIDSNVVIEREVKIGNHVYIQSGAIIGSDSFEYALEDGYKKIVNLGTVIIRDEVVIGANTTIARGTIGNTIIGRGTIIDNQVQIGHEVIIGDKCRICAQCGLAGWAVLEDNVTLLGKVGVGNSVRIEKNVIVLGMSGVSKQIDSGQVVSGIPAKKNSDYLREKIALKRLAKKERNRNEINVSTTNTDTTFKSN